jgi:hypothetical protein
VGAKGAQAFSEARPGHTIIEGTVLDRAPVQSSTLEGGLSDEETDSIDDGGHVVGGSLQWPGCE